MGGGVRLAPLKPTMVPAAPVTPALPALLAGSSAFGVAAGAGVALLGVFLVATGMTTNRYSRGARALPVQGVRAARSRPEKVQGASRRTQALYPRTNAITARRAYDRQRRNRHGGPSRRERRHDRAADLHDDPQVLRRQGVDSPGAGGAVQGGAEGGRDQAGERRRALGVRAEHGLE